VWPEFRETATQPSSTDVPNAGTHDVPLTPAQKKLDVHLAITEYRSGKWAPKRVSEQPVNLDGYANMRRENLAILPLDFTWAAGGPFLLFVYNGTTSWSASSSPAAAAIPSRSGVPINS
jgi:hypothetical protein